MLNQWTVNQYPINYSTLPLIVSQDVIAFNGYSLQNSQIITTEIDFDDLSPVELNTYKYPRDNGGGVLSKFYRGKDITLTITIKASTASAFSTLMDDFKKNLRYTEGNLDMTVNGEIRRIRATCTSIDFNRKHYNVTYATTRVKFQSVEPFLYAKDAQSFQFQWQTNSFSGEFTNAWSAESLPALYFIFWAGTTATALSVTSQWKTITMTTAFTQNDILIIDSKNKSITKNGVEIDYTGQFPSFPPWSCPFQVAITWTSLLDLTAVVPKNYL